MPAVNTLRETSPETPTVTGTLLDLIRQGKATTDRLLRENEHLRMEVARLTCENAELRGRLRCSAGEMPE